MLRTSITEFPCNSKMEVEAKSLLATKMMRKSDYLVASKFSYVIKVKDKTFFSKGCVTVMVVGEDEDVNAVTEFINKYVGSDYTEE